MTQCLCRRLEARETVTGEFGRKVPEARGPTDTDKRGKTGRTSNKASDSKGNGREGVFEMVPRCAVQSGEFQK